jgi:hypothetical protein
MSKFKPDGRPTVIPRIFTEAGLSARQRCHCRAVFSRFPDSGRFRRDSAEAQ